MDALELHTVDGAPVVVATIDDGKANALTLDLVGELHGIVDGIGPDAALVVAGRPGTFSGGLDLDVAGAGGPPVRALVGALGRHFIATLNQRLGEHFLEKGRELGFDFFHVGSGDLESATRVLVAPPVFLESDVGVRQVDLRVLGKIGFRVCVDDGQFGVAEVVQAVYRDLGQLVACCMDITCSNQKGNAC